MCQIKEQCYNTQLNKSYVSFKTTNVHACNLGNER